MTPRLRHSIAVVTLLATTVCSRAPGEPTRDPARNPAGTPAGISTCWSAAAKPGDATISFSDQTDKEGLTKPLRGMLAHATGFGDVDGDGWLDLFVGTFGDRPEKDYRKRGADGPSPDRLLRGGPDGFAEVEGFAPELARTSGAVFADLDGDGDLDLVSSHNSVESKPEYGPSVIYRNDDGVLEEAVQLPAVGGRSVGVFDYDGDGRLDLFLTVDKFAAGASILLHNDGGLEFSDATKAAGLPTDMHSLGVSVADLTGDGLPDLFVGDAQRLFVNAGSGKFRAVDSSVFEWERHDDEDQVAGVTVGDVNRDAWPDLVVGQHFKSTLKGEMIPVRLYLHKGLAADGDPRFEDVTSEAGLPSLAVKAPGVELEDYDNDGLPDILVTASSKDEELPLIYRNTGVKGGIPHFSAVTPKPGTDTDEPHYWVTSTSGDVDRDGRLDVVLVEWDPDLPTVLLRNTSSGGHWLEVEYGRGGGIGIVVEARRSDSGHALISRQEITASHGYGSGNPPGIHFGLGDVQSVDLVVRPPGGGVPLTLSSVPVDRHIHIQGTCAGGQ